ncbi:hypothetical protein Hanom_Chr12g01064921 [Helianthus anomalus]
MQNYYRAGGLTGSSLSILQGRGKAFYILTSLDPTLALLLVGFTEYDDDDDDNDDLPIISINILSICYFVNIKQLKPLNFNSKQL